MTAAATVLAPRFWLPLAIALGGLALSLTPFWPLGTLLLLFALFLTLQAATLRLHFTETSLEIYRGDRQIRSFPYQDWRYWQVYWPPVPILFYFREVNSIHFLPMLFDANQLQQCLETHCRRWPQSAP